MVHIMKSYNFNLLRIVFMHSLHYILKNIRLSFRKKNNNKEILEPILTRKLVCNST